MSVTLTLTSAKKKTHFLVLKDEDFLDLKAFFRYTMCFSIVNWAFLSFQVFNLLCAKLFGKISSTTKYEPGESTKHKTFFFYKFIVLCYFNKILDDLQLTANRKLKKNTKYLTQDIPHDPIFYELYYLLLVC
jgi:hypothetical protein